jgi:DNA-binding Xre family transcriptional regulator
MTDAAKIVAALKKSLKTRGVTYAQLARELDLSEASVKRVFSDGSFTLKRLEQICRILELDLHELTRISRAQTAPAGELTPDQETALAQDPRLLTVFHLLLNDYSLKDICREYEISETEGFRLINQLDRLGLIELRPNNAVRLRVSRRLSWRADGPLRALYDKRIAGEFLDMPFSGAAESLRFEAKELSAASLAVMRRKIERLAAEFNELAEIDAALPPGEKQNCAMLLAIRPWVFSLVSALKRR